MEAKHVLPDTETPSAVLDCMRMYQKDWITIGEDWLTRS